MLGILLAKLDYIVEKKSFNLLAVSTGWKCASLSLVRTISLGLDNFENPGFESAFQVFFILPLVLLNL